MYKEIGKDYEEAKVLIDLREYNELRELKKNLDDWKNQNQDVPIAVQTVEYGGMGLSSYRFRLFNESEYMELLTTKFNDLQEENKSLQERISKQINEIQELRNTPIKKWYQNLFK